MTQTNDMLQYRQEAELRHDSQQPMKKRADMLSSFEETLALYKKVKEGTATLEEEAKLELILATSCVDRKFLTYKLESALNQKGETER